MANKRKRSHVVNVRWGSDARLRFARVVPSGDAFRSPPYYEHAATGIRLELPLPPRGGIFTEGWDAVLGDTRAWGQDMDQALEALRVKLVQLRTSAQSTVDVLNAALRTDDNESTNE